MRMVMMVIGTWGDIRPNVLLGQALHKEGYEVIVCASENYRDWVESHGLSFFSLTVDIEAITKGMINTSNPFAIMDYIKRNLNPALLQVGKEVASMLKEGDALFVLGGGLGLVNGLVEKFKLHLFIFNLQPTSPSRELTPLAMPHLPDWLPFRKALNYQLGYLSYRMTYGVFGPRGNALREHLGLPNFSWKKQLAMLESSPTITAVSRHVLPELYDWKPHQILTGFLLDEESDWQAPQALLDFLAAGEKPIYIGFGSMGDREAEATTKLLLEAIERSGKRAILLSGWAGFGSVTMPKNVFLLDYAPQHWLFPRMAAVVHHGGAGTTAAGLAAGLPSVIVPFFGDQPNWAQIVYELGVSTKPIPRHKLTADKLVAAIQEATSNPSIQAKAVEIGAKIRAENAASEAVKAVKKFLG
jgi:sterol 3beta-glucosyltransferase